MLQVASPLVITESSPSEGEMHRRFSGECDETRGILKEGCILEFVGGGGNGTIGPLLKGALFRAFGQI